MNRALSLLLTVALVGSLMFMGFAGTAAAQSNDAEVTQVQQTEQVSSSSSDGSVAIAFGDDASANTGNSVEQTSTNTQTATVDQTNTNIEDSLFLDFGL